MQKQKIITILIIVVVVLLAVIFFVLGNKKVLITPVLLDSTIPSIENKEQILGNKDDLVSFTILSNTKVHGILSYSGVIKGGYFFEANILINILDVNKNVIKSSNAVAKTDWMTSGPVNFEGNIDFTGLPFGPAYFEIHNDNASGLPENDKSILIPIIIN
jgi:hypothetical protein